MNIPNQITVGRLLLTIVFFGLMSQYSASDASRQWVLPVCFWVFLVAALTDFLDGYLARTWGQVTAFGRVLDPVVDKLMVCGAFVFFAGANFHVLGRPQNLTGVAPWMVVLILTRELLVSAIRSFSESNGHDFAANWVGKFKSFIQFTTVCVILGVLAWFESTLAWLRVTCVWATVIVTALSIISYLKRAQNLVLSPAAMGAVTRQSTASAMISIPETRPTLVPQHAPGASQPKSMSA